MRVAIFKGEELFAIVSGNDFEVFLAHPDAVKQEIKPKGLNINVNNDNY